MKRPIDIHKAGGVIIQNRKFLVTRSVNKTFFIAPGGKLEGNENSIQALAREMMEEVQVRINTQTLESLGSFVAKAAGKEDKVLQMDVFIIHDYDGMPTPSNEVEEIKWINTKTTEIDLGSIFEHEVMPILKERNLID
jgi:8-oxo-dGTP pyrophosphatase MutT (NUDIX family)